ncbi:natterin-3-like [Sander lucioperca]|uniref:Natterin-3-like n=1 Tax=Sander lucioperca TaxID=283035 RepID=A0A8C9Z4I0_SANLU|nr:natterin-3-like [Sander lucioperca]
MKLSVLLLLALLALSTASPLDILNSTEQRKELSPEITASRWRLTYRPFWNLSQKSDDGSNLKWVTWNNFLPNDAVSIHNDYVDRIDYVCKYMCEAGFYTPSKGPYCHYPNAKKAYSGSPFEILVNKNNFEILEWKEDSYGSVFQSSVRTCPRGDTYVGKNKYGLGKVATKDKAFYLPWYDDEYWYHYYQVLTINEDIISQQIYNVRYNTDESQIFHYPPEVMRNSTIKNYNCNTVVQTDSLSKTYEVEHRWGISFSVTVGVTLTFSASIPLITTSGIQFSTEVSFDYSKGNTMVEATTNTVSVQIIAPPNHSCMVNMMQYKYKVDIPFTASLNRTYANGVIHRTSITGTYDSVQVVEVQAMVDRCELLENSQPCT